MKCQYCDGIDRGGIKHSFERELAEFRQAHPQYVPLHERSSIGQALRKRGFKVLKGPGTYVSAKHLSFSTQCSWVLNRTLVRWEKGEII